MYNHRGFTLLELIITTTIIGILAGLVFTPFVQKPFRETRDSQRVNELRELQTALELYSIDSDGFPDTGSAWWANCDAFGSHGVTGSNGWIPNLAPNYVDVLPVDPRPNVELCHIYRYRSDGTDYKLVAYRTAEELCPQDGDPFYDPGSVQSLCVLAAFSPGARLW